MKTDAYDAYVQGYVGKSPCRDANKKEKDESWLVAMGGDRGQPEPPSALTFWGSLSGTR